MFEFHYKFNEHTRANAEYINVNLEDEYILKSYRTRVAFLKRHDDGRWSLFIKGKYSKTTIKHIGWFMELVSKETGYPVSYHDVKDAIGNSVVYISKTEGITFSPCKE